MTQKNQPGYPLPVGELGGDELVCQLVYLPDRPEYWQALYAGLHYFATWRAWERDDDRRGKDAAANWSAAFEKTSGCWRMTCLEELTQDVEDILQLLQTKKDCCDDNITYLPTEEVETEIDPGVGDPPEFYGETAVEDWDEWNEYLCYNAHKYVDYLASVSTNLWVAIRNSAIGIGVIAAGLTLLAASGVGLPIAFATAATIVGGILLIGQTTIFDDSEANIESARDAIVCAIMMNGDLAGAVETALGSGTDWDVFFQWIPYDTAMAIMYEGGHDGEYLPAELRDDCECVPTIPEGASSWPIEIISVSSPTFPGAQWTVHEFSTDGTSMFLDITNETGGGAYVHVDLLVKPSPYWGVDGVGHQGIAYDGVRYSSYGQVIVCESGFLHTSGTIGLANNDRWYLAVSNPHPGYDTELETYMGISFFAAGGTSGLDQDPNQNRTLRIRYWAKSGPPAGTRFQCRVEGLHWAYWKS